MGDGGRNDGESRMAALDKVLRNPSDARRQAVDVLSGNAPPTEQAEALWTIGKALYEDNDIAEAERSLNRALELARSLPELTSRIRTTLSLVQVKSGQIELAEETLRLAERDARPGELGRIRNQRGMLLSDQGLLVEALAEFERALELLQAVGDTDAAARTLCNLGAVCSNMWRLDEALAWYELAREATVATDQEVVGAGVDFNIGYVHGLRGDLPTALDWYDRARTRFNALEGVEFAEAALESDAARTLLDAGLHDAALVAARRALDRIAPGQNLAMEAQACLVLAEALVESGRHAEANEQLARTRALFEEIKALHGVAQVDVLALRIGLETAASDAAVPARADALSLELERLGWQREAIVIAGHGGLAALRNGDSGTAVDCVERFVGAGRTGGNPVDWALVEAVAARGKGDRRHALAAIHRGIRSVESASSSFLSSELRAGRSRTIAGLVEMGMELAIERGRATDVLRWADRSLTVLAASLEPTNRPLDESLIEEMRAAVARREVLRRSGADPAGEDVNIERIERRLREAERRRTTMSSDRLGATMLDVASLRGALDDATLIQFLAFGAELFAVVVDHRRCWLVRLGEEGPLRAAVQQQRSSLDRLGRPSTPARLLEQAGSELRDASTRIERLLHPALAHVGDGDVIIVPNASTREVVWGCLPTLQSTPLTIAESATAWMRGHVGRPLRSVGVVVGPHLEEAGAEGLLVAQQHASSIVIQARKVSDARRVLEETEVVHVASHGTFRADNPLFSSLQLKDGPLTVLEIERLHTLPDVVILGACGAASTAGSGGADLVGTAVALRRSGSGVVVASSVSISDRHAPVVMADLHRALAAGRSPQDAVVIARRRAVERQSPHEMAVAGSMLCHGTRRITRP